MAQAKKNDHTAFPSPRRPTLSSTAAEPIEEREPSVWRTAGKFPVKLNMGLHRTDSPVSRQSPREKNNA